MKKQGRISCQEAATRAMVSRETIRDWIHNGRLDGIQYAHNWFICEQSLNRVIEALMPRAS